MQNLYYWCEDKWYEIIEKLHLEGIIDKIDRIIPSFPLFVIIVLLLSGFLIHYLIYGKFLPTEEKPALIKILIQDEDGNPLANAEVIVAAEGKENTFYTDNKGYLSLELKKGLMFRVTVKKEGYEEVTKRFEAEERKFVITLSSLIELAKKRIVLSYPDGSLFNKKAVVMLDCSNPEAEDKQIEVENGILEFAPPENCGELKISVQAGNYRTLAAKKLAEDAPGATIYLMSYEEAKGKVKVMVKDEQNNALDGIEVILYNADGIMKAQSYTVQGIAEFEVAIGSYYVIANDPNGNYAIEQSDIQPLSKNETLTFSLTLKKAVKGVINVVVKDKSDMQPIANATVNIYKKGQKATLATTTTDVDGKASFPLSEVGSYVVEAVDEKHLSSSIEVKEITTNPVVEILLEPLTSQNSGVVKVKVVDEDNTPVENVQCFIYNAETDWLYPRQPVTTNAEGIAIFKGIPSGNYYIKAYKGIIEAKSQAKEVILQQENEFEVVMKLGKGNVRVIVRDAENVPIAAANVEIHPLGEGKAESILTDVSGLAERTLKAMQKVYVRVSKEGYASFVSELFTIMPNESKELNVVLQPELVGEEPKIEYLGLFEKELGVGPVQQVEPAKSYIARLRLILPKKYEEVVLHLRTGKTEMLEKDDIYIKDISISNATIERFTKYEPPVNEEDDRQSITYAEAKWAEIKLQDKRPGIYYLSVELRIKKRVSEGDYLPFYYRIYAVDDAGNYLRDPYDAELGNAESTPTKQGLYAKANEVVLWVGMPAACDEAFCYSGQRLFDVEDKLYLAEPYSLAVGNEYELSFEITNNSDVVYNKAEIRIKSVEEGKLTGEGIEIRGYEIENADASVFKEENIRLYELPRLALGNYIRNKTIRGKLLIVPQKLGSYAISLQIVSEGNIVFSKEIQFSVLADNSLQISIEPEFFAAFVENEAKITVTDAADLPVENARVIISKLSYNKIKLQLGVFYTDKSGTISFTFPSANPNSKFIIEAEKRGYEKATKEIVATAEVLQFEPEEVKEKLQLIGQTEKEVELKITNLFPKDLVVVDAKIKGRFKGYLDKETMQAYVNSYLNMAKIPAKDYAYLKLLKLIVAEDADFEHLPITLNGSLSLILESPELKKRYSLVIPFNVTVEAGAKLEREDCLYLDGRYAKEWNVALQYGKAETGSLSLYNVCKAAGKNVKLRNLKASIEWESNNYGEVYLTLTNFRTGEQIRAALQEGVWTELANEVENSLATGTSEAAYYANIEFLPKSYAYGETAKFKVIIAAEIPSAEGMKTIQAKELSAEISVMDLTKCIKFTPDADYGVTIDYDKDESEFTINASDCGKDIMVRFCSNDRGCKGNTEYGGIKFKGMEDVIYSKGVKVSGEKVIKVMRGGNSPQEDVPGIYGITIEAKLAEGGSWQYIDTYNVYVKPKWKSTDSGYAYHYFDLDKYSYVLLDKNDVETATLLNRMFEEKVKVEASLYRWKKANRERRLWTGLFVAGGAIAAGYALGAALSTTTTIITTLTISIPTILGEVSIGIPIATTVTTTVGWIPVVGWIAAGIAAIVAVGSYLHAQHKLHTKMETHELVDFVINFSTYKDYGDFKKMNLYDELKNWLKIDKDVLQNYQVVESELGNNKRLQLTPIKFERKDYKPKKGVEYGVIEFCATEHIHGDEAHVEPEVHLGDKHTPGMYGIKDTKKKEYCQKFHLRFKVAAQKQALPKLGMYECRLGGMIGSTGSEALPDINYTWNWNNIDMDFCSRYYCDAAQFTTVIMKRIYALHEFLEKNNYLAGVCPKSNLDKAEKENSKSYVNKDGVDTGKVGFEKYDVNFNTETNVADVSIVVANKSSENVEVTIKTELKSVETETVVQSCEETITIAPNSNETISCKFDMLQQGSYYAIPEITSVTPSSIEIDDWADVIALVVITQPAVSGCDIIKTTERIAGRSVLSYFLDSMQNVKSVNYDGKIIDANNIDELLYFDAKLMRDAFSMDFRQDYINTASWLGLPTWLKPNETSNGPFYKYLLDNEKMKFMLKYAPNVYRLSAPGKYKVEIVAVFGKEWRFFDVSNEPKDAGIAIVFYRYDDPEHDSALYYLPLDGKVGLEGNSYERQGYGVGFENLGDLIKINNEILSYEAYASNPIAKVTTNTANDFRTTNVTNRGVLLDIKRKAADSFEMNYAANEPVAKLVEIDGYEPKDEEYIAAYQVLINNKPQNVGPIMTYWNGCGECYDFTGSAIAEAFDNRPDAIATPQDRGIADWQHSYVLRWPLVYKTGTLTLATIFFKPVGKDIQIVPVTNNFREKQPSDNSGTVASDNSSIASEIETIEKIFGLVKKQEVCVMDNGIEIKFFWNPAKIYSQIASDCVAPEGCIEE